jgi:hypothetical protein
MLMTHFIWQTVLRPLSVTNAKNAALTPSLTPTMQARCYNAGKWVRATWRGITNSSKHLGALLVVLGDLVDVAAWGIVPCVSKIDTLGGGGRGEGGRRGQLSRRSSIQGDEISCIRDHLK